MTSSPDHIQPTSLIPYTPPQSNPLTQSMLMIRITDIYMQNSFKTQMIDFRFFPPTIRERILAGKYIHPTHGSGTPEPFCGTRNDLLKIIEETVHETISSLDYDGAKPYFKILDQLENGKTFAEVQIDSTNEEYGSTCIGSAHAILKVLKDQFNIDGMLAVQRKRPNHPFEHGAVIVECSDGFVLLDARANPHTRIFSVPFNKTMQYPGLVISASHSGSNTPLTLNYPDQELEYCTNVGNGDDLVMKHFVMDAPFNPGHEFFPIATFNEDGSDRKFIGVSLKDSALFLKDRMAPKGTRAENIPFTFIRNNPEAFLQKLQIFMEPNESLGPIEDPKKSFSGFHIPVEVAFQQLSRLASQEKRLQRLFLETHPNVVF